MKSLESLQRSVDLRNADLAELGRHVTAAVRRYKRRPTPAQHRKIAQAVHDLRLAHGDPNYIWRARP